MLTMNISLPDPLKEFVDDRIAKAAATAVSKYPRVDSRLLLESKETELTRADIDDIRNEALAPLRKRKS